MDEVKMLINIRTEYKHFLSLPNKRNNNMSENTNYGKKGAYFLGFLAFLIIFVALLIWVYSKNQEFLLVL